MAQIETKQTAQTFAERFGRVAANGLAATAALASAFMPMTGAAQEVSTVAVAPTHTFALQQCVTGDQLRAAGQNPVIMAEKMVPTATNRPLIVYTANTQAVGYELVADRPVRMLNNGQFTQPERPACYTVAARLVNVRLNDVATGGVRRDFYQPIANSDLNRILDNGLRNGNLPLLQATIVVEGRRGPLVTVFSDGTNGSVVRASQTGVTANTDTLRPPTYTQYSTNFFPPTTRVVASRELN